MFFLDRINPLPGDRVLEVGPGAAPHPRSQTFLDVRFTDNEAFRQRGGLPPVEYTKPVIYYDGGRFPFRDKEFDYVICSHVLEHTENPEAFLGELGRVAARGYLEFPTIHYDYLYNFKEHLNLLLHKDGEILWMPKDQTTLNDFSGIQEFLRATLHSGYHELVQAMKDDFFSGIRMDGPNPCAESRKSERTRSFSRHTSPESRSLPAALGPGTGKRTRPTRRPANHARRQIEAAPRLSFSAR